MMHLYRDKELKTLSTKRNIIIIDVITLPPRSKRVSDQPGMLWTFEGINFGKGVLHQTGDTDHIGGEEET